MLLGNRNTKRTDFFGQAAKKAGLPVLFVDWEDLGSGSFAQELAKCLPQEGCFLKIDPPLWDSYVLSDLDRLAAGYIGKLGEISKLAQGCGIAFLNHPMAIAHLLDKEACKETLSKAGLPVTEQLWAGGKQTGPCPEEYLIGLMRQKGICQVFIKPVNGSGAAGVSAFRMQPATGRMALYTCAAWQPGIGLVNTKRLRRLTSQEEILPLLRGVLGLGCIVERWYAKEAHEGFSYDLRVAVLDGRIDFSLARLSKGPVTNLHLNNHPFEASRLGLPGPVWEEIGCLCQEAIGCFRGLRYAGIDILLEKGSLKPRIIEMNAQGDLIYLDIYGENRIYQRQAEAMKKA